MEKDLVHDPLLDLALAYWAMQMGFAQESPPTYEEVQDKGRELAAALDLRYILDAENAFGPIWYRKFRLQFGICAEEVRYWTVEETMASKVRNRWQSDDDIIDIAKQDALLRYPNRRVHDEKPRNDVDIGNGKEGEGVVSGANLDEAAKPMDECVEAENSFDENHLTDVGLEQEAAVKALMRLSLTVESNLAEAIQDPLCPRRHLWKREEQLHAVHVVLDLLGASISPLGRRANDIDELDQITSETWTSQDRREALSVALDRINLSSPTDCRAYAVLKAMYGMEVAIE
ncbi:hypothetical protein BGX28_003880 [Mortierella sp. GBA30]|nr:hypothetical protein BGX28_003880 [Mortierella sp. GBA30]